MKIIEPTSPKDDGQLRIDPTRGAVIFDPWPFDEFEVILGTHLYATTVGVEENGSNATLETGNFPVLCWATDGRLCAATRGAWAKANHETGEYT